MDPIIFGTILLIGALIGAYAFAISDATHYWGRKIDGKPSDEEFSDELISRGMDGPQALAFAATATAIDRGRQDEISPISQTLSQMVFVCFLLYSAIGGWIHFKWYIGVAAFFAMLIVPQILRIFLPGRKSEFWRHRIQRSLESRSRRLARHPSAANAPDFFRNKANKTAMATRSRPESKDFSEPND